MNVLTFDARLRVLAALVEGTSIRSTERLTRVHRDTIMRFGVLVGDGCGRLHDRLVVGLHGSLVEIDEVWCFVSKKQRRVEPDDPAEFGDQYLFVAMDATNRAVLAYRVDKRTSDAAVAFLCDLRRRVVGKPQITSDGWRQYLDAVEIAFGTEVHYAVSMKSYYAEETPEDVRRYSPGRIQSVQTRVVCGSPLPEAITTSHIERQNLTVRMQMRRFTRLTNGFSKRLPTLRAAVALHYAHYNFCRIHDALRVTPAMQAGVTDHAWTIAELLNASLAEVENDGPANDAAPPPTPPAPPSPEERRRAWRVIDGGRGE